MKEGVNHSLSILVSSPTHSSSFTEERKTKGATDPHTMIVDAKLWDVKPEGTYSSEKLYIFKGNELDAFIVNTITDINNVCDVSGLAKFDTNMSIKEAIRLLPYKGEFVAVPIDFKKSFEVDIIASLQEIAVYQ